MQGHSELGYMPDYEPASVSPSAEPPSVGVTFSKEDFLSRQHHLFGKTESEFFNHVNDFSDRSFFDFMAANCQDCE